MPDIFMEGTVISDEEERKRVFRDAVDIYGLRHVVVETNVAALMVEDCREAGLEIHGVVSLYDALPFMFSKT